MSCSSSLIDIACPLVLDTSVLINLRACRYGDKILAAIPNDIIVPGIVAGELEHETSRRNGEHGFLQGLVASGIVTLANLTDPEFDLFHELTSSAPSLDDGEAATIAVAVARSLLPIVDERRGRARAGHLLQSCVPGWSLDILRHPAVVAALGDESATEALYLALRYGRMRIPLESVCDVVELVGESRSRDCTCLPGYRERFCGARNNIIAVSSIEVANQETGE